MNKNITRKKFNVSLLGESQVGKTGMINAYFGKKLGDEASLSTIGIESYLDAKTFNEKEYKFKIYDTAGQERYRSISQSTIKITDGFILVFAVDNKKSFEHINYWYDSIKEVIDAKKKIIILVGNKIDLEKRQVDKEEAFNFAKSKNMKYFETSAKTGEGIQEAFGELYKDVFDLYITNKNDEVNNFELEEEEEEKPKKKKSRC